ncbi:MAG: ATP-binding cassette domain-containing protein [Lachnospiraceae bacterium]|nr:ATP-binding cassette domain-containing protein [Lachnospiraceae bacterium]
MLKVESISKTFHPGTPDAKKALDNLSFSLEAGDFVTIIGSNGAGKSTLFGAISGDFLTDQGAVYLDGKDITFDLAHKRAKYIGRLFQDPMKGTAPGMSIEDNMALALGKGGWLSHLTKGEKQDFRDALSVLDMGLEQRMKQPVGLLSGGQRQALTLMMATMSNPKLLLLDEHTAALDPATASKVLQITKDVVGKRAITTLMITHNMKDALSIGNRTFMMESGKIVLDLDKEQKKTMTVADLLEQFKRQAGKELDNDRMLFS